MGQTRKNILSHRSKYFSQVVLTKDLTGLIIITMKVKQKKLKGVIC